jgi:hypothetical protein
VPAGSLLEGGVLGGTGCANVLVFSGVILSAIEIWVDSEVIQSVFLPPMSSLSCRGWCVSDRLSLFCLFLKQTIYA